MELEFREAAVEDIEVIAALADKIWRAHYPGIITTAQIDYMLANRYSQEAITGQMLGGEKYFLAYAGNEAVAYASIELVPEGYYYLHKFYLAVTQHRNGIGRAFFNYLLQQVDANKPVKLQVNRQNIKAINFYFKMGFTLTAVGDFDIGGGWFMNDFVMELPIRQ